MKSSGHRNIVLDLLFTSVFWHASNDIRITWINDSQCAYSVASSTLCAQFSNIATVLMDQFGQHGKTHCFRFPQDWAVDSDDQFHFTLPDHLQSLLVPQHVLPTFHNQLEPRVDWLQWPFHLLCGHHVPVSAGLPPNQEQLPRWPGYPCLYLDTEFESKSSIPGLENHCCANFSRWLWCRRSDFGDLLNFHSQLISSDQLGLCWKQIPWLLPWRFQLCFWNPNFNKCSPGAS